MDKKEAINVIEQALSAATQKGVFNLADITYVLKALEALKGK
jgi:hypothetical protein